LSVVPNFHKLKKYNINQLCEEKPAAGPFHPTGVTGCRAAEEPKAEEPKADGAAPSAEPAPAAAAEAK